MQSAEAILIWPRWGTSRDHQARPWLRLSGGWSGLLARRKLQRVVNQLTVAARVTVVRHADGDDRAIRYDRSSDGADGPDRLAAW